MNLRLALYELAHTHGLDAQATQALFASADLEAEPPALQRRLWPAVGVLACAMAGLGIIMWLAANWDTLGRTAQFALLQALVLAACAGAAWRSALRVPLGLLGLLAIGGLFAFFGQTYQTGADPWQLFALWAVLALPLCLGARSDVLWTPWAMVAMTAISLWTYAHTGRTWSVESSSFATYAMAWAASALLALWLSPWLAARTGAGPWALRAAVTMGVVGITLNGVIALFSSPIAPHYILALAVFALACAVLGQRKTFEVFALSAVGLGLNTLLVAGLAHVMFDAGRGDVADKLLLIGLAATGMLAASVSAITRLARAYASGSQP